MDRKVDAPIEQRLLDLLGEEALAADLGQRPVEDAVAAGADDDDLEVAPWRSRARRRGGPRSLGLGERERAAAGADAEVRTFASA